MALMKIDIGEVRVTGGFAITIGLSPTLDAWLQGQAVNTNAVLARIEQKLDATYTLEKTMADTLDDLVTDVADEKTVIDGAIILLDGIDARLAAAGTDPVKLAALRTSIQGQKTNLAAAVVRNTPAAPPVP